MVDKVSLAALAARDTNMNGGRMTAHFGNTGWPKELALLCVRMFPEESNKIERNFHGLPDMIHGNIVASKPKKPHKWLIEMALNEWIRKSAHC
ncbi:hypothetical protein Tco_0642833 [Tanacetum coccineum]